MIAEQVKRYGIGKPVVGAYEDAIRKVKDAFAAEGFGVVSEIDMAATLAQKTSVQIEPYTILGMCNPQLALKALGIEREIGLLLPCNVIVYVHNGETHVAAQDPEVLMQVVARPELQPVEADVKGRILRAMMSL